LRQVRQRAVPPAVIKVVGQAPPLRARQQAPPAAAAATAAITAAAVSVCAVAPEHTASGRRAAGHDRQVIPHIGLCHGHGCNNVHRERTRSDYSWVGSGKGEQHRPAACRQPALCPPLHTDTPACFQAQVCSLPSNPPGLLRSCLSLASTELPSVILNSTTAPGLGADADADAAPTTPGRGSGESACSPTYRTASRPGSNRVAFACAAAADTEPEAAAGVVRNLTRTWPGA